MASAILERAKEAGRRVNDVVATILLLVVFFLVLTPSSLVRRIVRGRVRPASGDKTYRIPVDRSTARDLTRQF